MAAYGSKVKSQPVNVSRLQNQTQGQPIANRHPDGKPIESFPRFASLLSFLSVSFPDPAGSTLPGLH